MPTEELLTRWTIRLALVCYVAVLAGKIAWRPQKAAWRHVVRGLWTLGCLLFLAHVACAFEFYHGWSHTRVLEDTSKQTYELMGWAFGEGIYFSYLFTLLWLVDVLWWWVCPTCYEGRGRALDWGIHGFMLFIAFNGAIVFEGGFTRWVGIVACAALAALAVWKVMTNPQREADTSRSPSIDEAPGKLGG
jgi:hypothetical protein